MFVGGGGWRWIGVVCCRGCCELSIYRICCGGGVGVYEMQTEYDVSDADLGPLMCVHTCTLRVVLVSE